MGGACARLVSCAAAMSDDGSLSDSGSASGSESPSPKRARGGGGFDNMTKQPELQVEPPGGPSAESQLEAMLAAEGGMPFGAPPGAPGGPASKGPPVAGAQPRVETTPMDFSRLVATNLPTKDVPVPKGIVEALMTPTNRTLMIEESGAEVEWAHEERLVKLRGSQEQLKRGTRLLQRVLMHCHWGVSEDKISRLMRPRQLESVICRLSPMNTLRPVEKVLSASSPVLSIGKEKGTNVVVINDPIISRQHCVMELDMERGAVYVIDCSTNGTFLNGTRLPSKTVGKVLLSHGDELLFKDPNSGEQEFGYIVNLNELQVKAQVKLEAPRRIVNTDDWSAP